MDDDLSDLPEPMDLPDPTITTPGPSFWWDILPILLFGALMVLVIVGASRGWG